MIHYGKIGLRMIPWARDSKHETAVTLLFVIFPRHFLWCNSKAARCRQVGHINLQCSIYSVNRGEKMVKMLPAIKQIKWHTVKCDSGRGFKEEIILAVPSWRCPHTACRPRRYSNRTESFLCSPCSTLKSDSASRHTLAEYWNVWQRASRQKKKKTCKYQTSCWFGR